MCKVQCADDVLMIVSVGVVVGKVMVRVVRVMMMMFEELMGRDYIDDID